MSYLVVGGAGFIGSYVVRQLVEQGQAVVSFGPSPVSGSPARYSEKVMSVRGDIACLDQLLAAMREHSVRRVVHLAVLHGSEADKNPYQGILVNILGAANVLEAARLSGVERVVCASGILYHGVQELYGQRPINEDEGPRPVNLYSSAKVTMEFMARRYAEAHGLDVRSLRICTAFGHGRTRGMTGWTGAIASLPAIGRPVHIPFSPEERSAMIYVKDLADVFVKMAMAGRLRYPTYLTGGHVATIAEVAHIVREYLPQANITFGHGRMPHVYLVDNRRLVEDLNLQLRPLSEGLLDHINEARQEAGLPTVAQ